MQFTPAEKAAAFLMRDWVRAPHTSRPWGRDKVRATLSLTDEQLDVVLLRLEERGVINDQNPRGVKFQTFSIEMYAVDFAYAIELQDEASKDIVERLSQRFKSHPIPGALIVAAIVLGTLLTLTNAAFDLADHLADWRLAPASQQNPPAPAKDR